MSDQAVLKDVDFKAHADFRYALRRFLRSSEENARAAGITPQQHQLLLAIRGHRAHPHVNISEIAEHLQVRHHSASLLVDRLVKRGLLTRRPDAGDQRRMLVDLTLEGERTLEAVTIANRVDLRALDRALGHVQASLTRLRVGHKIAIIGARHERSR
jgi:DNA-binding MarR family transcriptional regulator